ncbi:MAG: LamG-like jellyroll fold domain-containing protein [Phycisphaerales bacterium]
MTSLARSAHSSSSPSARAASTRAGIRFVPLAIAAGVALVGLIAPHASAGQDACLGQSELIILRSGQVNGAPGLPGQADSAITYASDPGPNCVNTSLDTGSGLPFAAAAGGPAATVITPIVVWAPNLPSDPAARWINWSAGPAPDTYGFPPHSVLYAHPFTVGGSAILGATITLTWAVDDLLGDPVGDPAPIGAYVNGQALPALTGGNYASPTTVTTTIPASALVPGANTLYLYQRDLGCGGSGLIYSASIEVCVAPAVPSCVEPPPNMLGWWPFDEPAGLIAHDLTANSNNGNHQPAVGGPTPVPGIVSGALSFDGVNDVVVVPPTPALDISCGAFSVDLWVKRDVPAPGAGLQTLVSHYLSNGGWIFGLDAGTGQLQLISEGNSLRCVATSTATVPVGAWTHVAVTVSACCGPFQRQVTFYVNGVAAGSFPSSCCDLTSLGGPASIKMGGAVWVSDWFKGAMDEVEYFCRVLLPGEVAALHGAGSAGKCKASCHASWDRQLCFNFGFSTQVDATIVNNSTVGRTYQYTITENGGCSITGVVYTPSSGTVFVGPGGQATVNFTATIPGPILGQGCYNVTFTNLSNNTTCTATGSFISEICGFIVLPDPTIANVGINETANATFRVIAGPDGASVPYQIVAMPSNMAPTGTDLSLNGLPPGEPVIGQLDLAPNQVAVIDLSLWFNTCGAIFDWTDVIFYGPNFDGTFGALSSFGVLMVKAPSCLGDLNDDGVVNGADLGILLSGWGSTGPGDFNEDGVVDGADLGIMLGAWGPCP